MKLASRLFGILALFLLALAGCHELGHVDGPGDYGRTGDTVVGEVRNVDTRGRQIELRSDTGRTWLVGYDSNTRVIYRQREYAVTNLERGDYVAIRTQQDRDGRLHTDLVTVRESVQDRSGSGRVGRLDRFEGRVEYVDPRRGLFEVRDQRDRLVTVAVPFNAPRAVTDRFNRLRQGDYVRAEGRFTSQDRFELENFM
jgi:hypothetical protein